MRKERPILFSTDMVQAILEGRKTITRRVISPQPVKDGIFWKHPGNRPKAKRATGAIYSTNEPDFLWTILCKYGQPEDILWVKETYEEGCMGGYIYKAGRTHEEIQQYKQSGYKWKPSIFMPKAAARIWLEITDIKVERLYSISREDAIAEGCGREGTDYPEGNFYALWCKINGIESYQSNPWLWVISFKVLSTTGRPHEKLGPF